MALRLTVEQKENLYRFAELLHNTELEQGKAQLKSSVGYCCLGVLLEEGYKIHSKLLDDGTYYFENHGVQTPTEDWFREKYGIAPIFFIGLNDEHEFTFEQIACIIEALTAAIKTIHED